MVITAAYQKQMLNIQKSAENFLFKQLLNLLTLIKKPFYRFM